MWREKPPPKRSWTGIFFRGIHVRCQEDPDSLPFPCRPLRFDFDWSRFTVQVVSEAAPSPILGTGHQSARDGIAVNVA
jgi:hypothetical protein